MAGAYVYTSNLWLPLAGAIALAVLSLYSWRRRSEPAAVPMAAGSLFAMLWLLSIAAGASAVAPATKIAWHKFQAAWHLPMATAMTCFALEYANPGRWLTRRNLILLAVPPLLVLFLIITNDTNLMWRQLEITPDGLLVRDLAAPGAILVVYGLCLVLVNTAVFLWLFVRSPQHRWPVALMLAGDLTGRSLYALNQLGADLTPSLTVHNPFVVALLLGWAMYAIALFGFRIFDPLPAARATAFAQMPEGLIVFDAQWRVASLNPAAAQLLSVPAGHERGKLITEILPASWEDIERWAGGDAAASGIRLAAGAGLREHDLNLTTLKDFRGLTIGRLLTLRDVTERRRAQALVQEQQRTLAMLQERERLARELHDGVAQVLAFMTTQGQTIHRLLARGEIAEADAHVGRLIEVAGEADTDLRESIHGLRAAFDAQGLLATLATYLGQYEKRYDIQTTLRAPLSPGDVAIDPLAEVQLLRIVQEALTNARKHAHASSVCVTFIADDGHAQVTVRDDGCGFDPQAAAGSGLDPSDDPRGRVGLRVMRERAEEAGGTLAVQSAPGEGTQVVVTVPLKTASR